MPHASHATRRSQPSTAPEPTSLFARGLTATTDRASRSDRDSGDFRSGWRDGCLDFGSLSAAVAESQAERREQARASAAEWFREGSGD